MSGTRNHSRMSKKSRHKAQPRTTRNNSHHVATVSEGTEVNHLDWLSLPAMIPAAKRMPTLEKAPPDKYSDHQQDEKHDVSSALDSGKVPPDKRKDRYSIHVNGGGVDHAPNLQKNQTEVDIKLPPDRNITPGGSHLLLANATMHAFLPHADWGTALIQRRAAHFLHHAEPQDIEDVLPVMWGLPKGVWVVLATVIAVAMWFGLVALALYFSRQKPPKTLQEQAQDEMKAAATRYFSLKGEDVHNPTPTFFGGMPDSRQSMPPSYGHTMYG